MMLDVAVLSLSGTIFKGEAQSVILPGEEGVFEVLPFHKRLLSRLVTGEVNIDGRNFAIRRGIAKVNQNSVTVIVEEK